MSKQSVVVVTGSSGFLGRALAEMLSVSSYSLRALVRSLNEDFPFPVDSVGDMDAFTDYSSVLMGAEIVVHAAARVHVMGDDVENPLQEFRRVNVEGTENLARQAAASGVRRFVFISSVKVSGESTTGTLPFNEKMKPMPEDDYALSKLEAEEKLQEIAKATGMEVVIVRPPLVYGPGVKANFRNLLSLAKQPFPLPFGLVNNNRSLVYVGNLVDFIIHCIDHPKAANQTFLISDGEDLSLRSLIKLIRRSMGKAVWLLPVPVYLFRLLGKLFGKMLVVDRLVGDLQVDSSKARELLGWVPPYSVQDGINETVICFKNRK